MHKGIVANPQNSMQPAAITREYSPMFQNYESDQAYSDRVFSDLKQSKETLDFELGINTLAVFWPYFDLKRVPRVKAAPSSSIHK